MQKLCLMCQQPLAEDAKREKKYCGLKCLKKAERQRAREKDCAFYAEQQKGDERFLWSEVSPTPLRVAQAVEALLCYDRNKPQGEREKAIEFVVSVPFDTKGEMLEIAEGVTLYQVMNEVAGRWSAIKKWLLQVKREQPLQMVATLPGAMPEELKQKIGMAVAKAEDLRIEREICGGVELPERATAPVEVVDQPIGLFQDDLMLRKKRDWSDIPTAAEVTEPPKPGELTK